tara:strand:+ start:620 stop:1021 length:402 start_codon:yes stop_codon:yes gene_type:complete
LQLTWSEDLSVGNEIIDSQHKKLFELFEDITRNPQTNLDRILEEVGNYINLHFAEEERWMARVGYPDISEHRQTHKAFVDSTLRMKMDHIMGGKLSPKQLTKFLQTWLVEHIQGCDLQIKQFCLDQKKDEIII